MGDVLVRGGTVVDGTGAAAFAADVRVRAGRITEVAPALRPDGEQQVDASGAFVTPGFIDTHTHFDPHLFWDPLCDPVPQHGVTTVLFGNCSLSLAPVRPASREELGRLFCYVEDLPEAAFDAAVPWSWESYAQYLDVVGGHRYGVNVASLVGHGPLRMYVMGEDAWERAATEQERAGIAALLDECLAAGAFGMSSSLGFDEDRRKRPVPSRIADDAELGTLMDVVAQRRRVVQFIPAATHGQMRRDVRRMIGLTASRDVVSTFIGIFFEENHPERAVEMLDWIGDEQRRGLRMYPQISPRSFDIRVNWNGGMSFFALPEGWHRFVQADLEAKRRLVEEPAWRQTARREWDRVGRGMFPHQRPDLVRLVEVTRPENEQWLGASLADLVDARGGHPSDVLADWVRDNDLRPGVVGVGVLNADPDGVAATVRHPAKIISNSDAGAHLQMFCAVGDTTLLLARHVRDRGDLTIEQAVSELTKRQADVFGFDGRGVITPGAAGDLAVFALDDLAFEAEVFAHDLPAGAPRLRRPPGGFRATIVDGEVAQLDGTLTGARAGRLLAP